ncbi:MAG: dihydropteroate synthase [Pseudomonadales bacterium]|nr:dihydropteroate synthase [Pseudomonadales bacterium]MCP5216203.1 dihydropteroate synthase [Pseudomonadales bacterium]
MAHTIQPRPSQQLNCGGSTLDLTTPQIMGILNVTPDSFSDGGRYFSGNTLCLDKALARAEQMLSEGAVIIDVGGESTRPGAEAVSLQEELDRVIPVIEAITNNLPTIISVDTSTPEVMLAAANAGAGLINDVRALTRKGALAAAATTGLPVCLMHMLNEPETMQQQPTYRDVVTEIYDYLAARMLDCSKAGIAPDKLLVDPGIGFGKTLEHNLQLLSNLNAFADLNAPLLIGVSRKTMIGQILNKPTGQRLYGSLAAATLAVAQGAKIIRCHDVAETFDSIRVASVITNAKYD